MKRSTLFTNEFILWSVTKSNQKIKRDALVYLIRRGFILILLLNFTLAFSACNKTDKLVLEAFEMRINGKVDEAKTHLENILSKDSTNAMAHFELARTLNYMNLRGSKEADLHLEKALQYEPENIAYLYYNAKNCFLKAYIALQTNGENAKKMVDNSCKEFIRVIELKADYPEALMYLVEFYGILPEDLGGDKVKAEQYAQQLEELDKFYGYKARLILLPQSTNGVEYWENYISANGEDCRALKELGIANLFKGDIKSAKKNFENAIERDSLQNIRLLDLARFYQMKVMQNREAASQELPKSKEYIEKYLASVPTPIPPLKAYAIGMLAKLEMFSENKAGAEKLMEEAKVLDPYFSRAFGIPSLALFEPPGKIDHHFQSYFSPY